MPANKPHVAHLQKPCPNCSGKKDYRAILCNKCRSILNPPQLGKGKHGCYRTLNHGGYMVIREPLTKHCRYEHRVVMERILGRPLRSEESVHHINGNRRDNRPENLQLFSSNAAHMRIHGLGKNLAAWNKNAAHRRVVFVDGKRSWEAL